MGDAIKAAARKRMAETGEPYALARRAVIEEHARAKAAGPEVTPENAQRLLAEGKITVSQAREAHGLPPFEPAAAEAAIGPRPEPRFWDYPAGGLLGAQP